MKPKVAVLGAGSFGTALTERLALNGAQVWLWGRNFDDVRAVAERRENPTYFPGLKLAAGIIAAESAIAAVSEAALVVIAVPAEAVREVMREIRSALKPEAIVVSTSKGLEADSGKRMSQVLAEELPPEQRVAVLSGPNFALEFIKHLPMAGTIAAKDLSVAEAAAAFFRAPEFRLYTLTDVVGVELGGVLKNAMALAAGIVDGLEMGAGARAALLTRGLAEMTRIVVALGGRAETVAGLSGLGDLLLTATTDLSRNRRVGVELGRGGNLAQIVASLGQVAEGVKTAETALKLVREKGLDAPILEELNKIVRGEISAKDAARNLLSREPRSES